MAENGFVHKFQHHRWKLYNSSFVAFLEQRLDSVRGAAVVETASNAARGNLSLAPNRGGGGGRRGGMVSLDAASENWGARAKS